MLIKIQKFRINPILVSLIILIILIIYGIFYWANSQNYSNISFQENIPQGQYPSTEDSLPTSSRNPTEFIPEIADLMYRDTMEFVKPQLKNWDENFIITYLSIRFGSEFKHLYDLYNDFYNTGTITNWISVRAYSPMNKLTRSFYGGWKNLIQSEKDTDMSMYGNMFKALSMTDYIPISPKNVVEKCMNYVAQKGNYYLYECFSIVSNYGIYYEGRSWMCSFIEVNQAKKTNYLFNLGTDTCIYDAKTDSVKGLMPPRPPKN